VLELARRRDALRGERGAHLLDPCAHLVGPILWERLFFDVQEKLLVVGCKLRCVCRAVRFY